MNLLCPSSSLYSLCQLLPHGRSDKSTSAFFFSSCWCCHWDNWDKSRELIQTAQLQAVVIYHTDKTEGHRVNCDTKTSVTADVIAFTVAGEGRAWSYIQEWRTLRKSKGARCPDANWEIQGLFHLFVTKTAFPPTSLAFWPVFSRITLFVFGSNCFQKGCVGGNLAPWVSKAKPYFQTPWTYVLVLPRACILSWILIRRRRRDVYDTAPPTSCHSQTNCRKQYIRLHRSFLCCETSGYNCTGNRSFYMLLIRDFCTADVTCFSWRAREHSHWAIFDEHVHVPCVFNISVKTPFCFSSSHYALPTNRFWPFFLNER